MSTYNAQVHKDGPDKLVVESGGTLEIAEGATVSGGSLVDGVTSSSTELNYNDGMTLGTVVASKTVGVDANRDIANFRNVTATGTVQGASVTATGALLAATAKVTTSFAFENGASDITFTIAGANVVVTNLPTVDPVVAGALWNDGGVLSISVGA